MDYQKPTDQLNPVNSLDKTGIAKNNIDRLTASMSDVDKVMVQDKNGTPLTMRTEGGSRADFQSALQNDSTQNPFQAVRIRMENESGQDTGSYANATLEVTKQFNDTTGRYDQLDDARMRLNDIFVPESQRGNGVGGMMLDRVEELAHDANAREVYGTLEREESRQFFTDRDYQFRGTNNTELYKTYYWK